MSPDLPLGRAPMPSDARTSRLLDRVALILIALEALTGVLLACYYRPTPEAAFESTVSIVRDQPLGWCIHQIHAWGAWALVLVVARRLLFTFWDGLYRAPRAALWWCAMGMVCLVLQLDFTGHLLPWDSGAYWSAVRGLEVVHALPLLGPALSLVLGGSVANETVLIRFYVLHLLVLPAGIGLLLYFALTAARRASSELEGHAGKSTTLGDQIYAIATPALLILGLLVTLAVLAPFRLAGAADPYATPRGVRPPWYLLAPYAVIERGPGPTWLLGLLLLAAALAVLLLPWWAQRLGRGLDPARLRWLGVAALAAWLALSVAGAMLERR